MKECIGMKNDGEEIKAIPADEQEFIFIRLNILREYLEKELFIPNLPMKQDFEVISNL